MKELGTFMTPDGVRFILREHMEWGGRYGKLPRLYPHFGGSIMEHFKARLGGTLHGRDERKWYRKQMFPLLRGILGLPSDTRIYWNRKAGCSCGCSPGFVLRTDFRAERGWRFRNTDYYIRILGNDE